MQRIEEKFFEAYNIPKETTFEGFERLKEYDKVDPKFKYPEIDEHQLLQLVCICRTIPDEGEDDVKCWSYVPNISDLQDEVLEKLVDHYINYTDDKTYERVRRVFHA